MFGEAGERNGMVGGVRGDEWGVLEEGGRKPSWVVFITYFTYVF